MKSRILLATAIAATGFALPGPARAHVSVYVAGVAGAPVNAVGGTYAVSLAPGHGCTGPRTPKHPDGVYDTTSLEVVMPRSSTGAFIFPEVRAVSSNNYRATVRWTVDPANPSAKRVSSIVYDRFVLNAVNNGYAARDTTFLSFTVKLPTLAAIKTAGHALASGDLSTAAGATIYLPTMQYCDVTGMGVGIQSETSTPAGISDKYDPTCTTGDSVTRELVDNWTTVGNTPSITIGTASTPAITMLGNAPVLTAATTERFCALKGLDVNRDAHWSGRFAVKANGTGARLMIKLDDSSVFAGQTFRVRDTNGRLVATLRADANGNASVVRKKSAVKPGQTLVLYRNSRILATDVA